MIILKQNVNQIYDYFQSCQYNLYKKPVQIYKSLCLIPNSLLQIEIQPQYIIDKFNPTINYLDMSKDFDITSQNFKLYNVGSELPCKIQWFTYYAKSNILNIDISLNKNKKQKMFLINGQHINEFKKLYTNLILPHKTLDIKIQNISYAVNQTIKINYDNSKSTIVNIKNIKYQQYKRFFIYQNGLLYNVKTKQFYSNKKTYQAFLNILYSIAKNGLNHPIMFNYNKNNYFYKEAMTKFYIARILELPSIPSIIINQQDFYKWKAFI